MSDTPRTDHARDRVQPFEVRLYQASPLGFAGTSLAVLIVTFGSFALIASLSGRPPLFEITADGGLRIPQVVWIGFVLSMILTTALALTENGRRMWVSVEEKLVDALPPEAEALARGQALGIPRSWIGRYRSFALFGVLISLGINASIMLAQDIPPLDYLRSIGLWFLVFMPALYASGLRAGVDVAQESGTLKRMIRDHLEVDLFHLENLHVFGTIGLRAAFSWMIMAAVLLLFVADPSQLLAGLIAVLLAVAGGVYIFLSAARPVHDKITAAKTAELARIHAKMAEHREAALEGDADAAAALAGLTDYEIWVQQRPEWPISPTVGLRFSLYVLIPIIPIIASYLFENAADFLLTGV